jgi:hypothetical protein
MVVKNKQKAVSVQEIGRKELSKFTEIKNLLKYVSEKKVKTMASQLLSKLFSKI